MRVVVADTPPLNYLLLIDQVDLLPSLFDTVHIPDIVRDELAVAAAPPVVRRWIANPPAWLVIEPTPATTVMAPNLDAGEQAAIALAGQLKAGLILIDERAGAAAARANGFTVMGTLGILDLAAGRGMIDLPTSFARLTATTFRVAPQLIDALLAKHRLER